MWGNGEKVGKWRKGGENGGMAGEWREGGVIEGLLLTSINLLFVKFQNYKVEWCPEPENFLKFN